MRNYTYLVNQRSRYNTAKGSAHFVLVIPQIVKLIHDGRFLSVYYKNGLKDKLEFDGTYDEAKKQGLKVMEEIQELLNIYYHEITPLE